MFAAPVELDSDLAVSAAACSTLNFSGGVSGAGRALTFDGQGAVVLSGANTCSGGITGSGGTVLVTSATALAEGGSLTVGAGGTLVFDSAAAGSAIVPSAGASPASSATVSTGLPTASPQSTPAVSAATVSTLSTPSTSAESQAPQRSVQGGAWPVRQAFLGPVPVESVKAAARVDDRITPTVAKASGAAPRFAVPTALARAVAAAAFPNAGPAGASAEQTKKAVDMIPATVWILSSASPSARFLLAGRVAVGPGVVRLPPFWVSDAGIISGRGPGGRPCRPVPIVQYVPRGGRVILAFANYLPHLHGTHAQSADNGGRAVEGLG